jgi:hypothetical protein
MRSLFVLLAFVAAEVCGPGTAAAEDATICNAVLQSTVFNTGSTRSVETFASSFKNAFCITSWNSESDLQNRSQQAGFSYQKALTVIGLSASDASSQDKRTQAYSNFCSRTGEDIASSREFYNEFRTSDTAVDAWKSCVGALANRAGHFGISVPSPNLTGALVILRRVDTIQIPKLIVQSIQSTGADDVTCLYNGSDARTAEFPPNQTEISLTCVKAANANVDFTINTNWGNFGTFSLPGYGGRITDLQLELSSLRADLATASKRLANLGVTRSDSSQGSANTGFRSPGGNGLDMHASCPAGQVVVGIKVRVGGTCSSQCSENLDGRPLASYDLECAPLQLKQ